MTVTSQVSNMMIMIDAWSPFLDFFHASRAAPMIALIPITLSYVVNRLPTSGYPYVLY